LISSEFNQFCSKNKIIFGGIDLSPSQYPIKEKSIGTAIEGFGFGKFGELGTIFAIGFLTNTLQNIDRPKIGFSGFMQPLLEDYTIAQRHSENKVDITKIMLNSAVSALGLDTIPLPGDTPKESIFLLLLDTAMLSTRLNKPLTARLMPIIGKKAREMTEFEFEYFSNSKICKIDYIENFDIEAFLKKNHYLKI